MIYKLQINLPSTRKLNKIKNQLSNNNSFNNQLLRFTILYVFYIKLSEKSTVSWIIKHKKIIIIS